MRILKTDGGVEKLIWLEEVCVHIALLESNLAMYIQSLKDIHAS